MFKIYPSSFAMPVGNTTKTDYNNGCLRYMKFKDYLPKTMKRDFPELNKAIGVLGEQRVWLLLEKWYPGVELSIEESFKQELEEGLEVPGRADFILRGANIIVEVKTTKSASVRSQVITKGNLPDSYLGQLITYMTNFDITDGLVIVQYVHFRRSDELDTIGFIDRKFNVTVQDDEIWIDGNKDVRTVDGMLRFYDLAADALLQDKIPPRPITDKPCYFCPFNQICNNLNPPTTPNEFIKLAADLEPDYSKQQKPPRLPCHNVKKTKET